MEKKFERKKLSNVTAERNFGVTWIAFDLNTSNLSLIFIDFETVSQLF